MHCENLSTVETKAVRCPAQAESPTVMADGAIWQLCPAHVARWYEARLGWQKAARKAKDKLAKHPRPVDIAIRNFAVKTAAL